MVPAVNLDRPKRFKLKLMGNSDWAKKKPTDEERIVYILLNSYNRSLFRKLFNLFNLKISPPEALPAELTVNQTTKSMQYEENQHHPTWNMRKLSEKEELILRLRNNQKLFKKLVDLFKVNEPPEPLPLDLSEEKCVEITPSIDEVIDLTQDTDDNDGTDENKATIGLKTKHINLSGKKSKILIKNENKRLKARNIWYRKNVLKRKQEKKERQQKMREKNDLLKKALNENRESCIILCKKSCCNDAEESTESSSDPVENASVNNPAEESPPSEIIKEARMSKLEAIRRIRIIQHRQNNYAKFASSSDPSVNGYKTDNCYYIPEKTLYPTKLKFKKIVKNTTDAEKASLLDPASNNNNNNNNTSIPQEAELSNKGNLKKTAISTNNNNNKIIASTSSSSNNNNVVDDIINSIDNLGNKQFDSYESDVNNNADNDKSTNKPCAVDNFIKEYKKKYIKYSPLTPQHENPYCSDYFIPIPYVNIAPSFNHIKR